MDFLHLLGSSMQAFGRASDAYVADAVVPSVALWAVAIAAGMVLLEWVAARYRGRR